MSSLSVYLPNQASVPLKILTHGEDIQATLAEIGVRFTRQQIDPIKPGTPSDTLWPLLTKGLEELALSDAPKQLIDTQQQALDSYQAEHQRDTQSVYWVVGGRVLVYLNSGERIYAVECAKNDVLTLPANLLHWLNFGEQPRAVIAHLPLASVEPRYSHSLLPHQFADLF